LEIYRLLRKQKIKIGLLSNTSEFDYELGIKPIMRRAKMKFDAISLSFKVKAMKPEQKIFQDILRKLQVSPERCVYIDDIEKYIRAAERIGMKGILYKKYNQLVKKLCELGIKI